MVTLLITSFFILAFLAIAAYFWQKPRRPAEVRSLPQPPGRGLFIDGPPEGSALSPAQTEADAETIAAKRRELLERAAAGDQSTLLEAHQADDQQLYDEALSSLLAAVDSDPKLLSLLSYVTRNELPVTRKLAEKVIESYKRAPDRGSTARMLHLCALSNDAAVYQGAVEVALTFWRDGRLPEVSALELGSILEGEFWILSSSTRSSGAGFLLKRALRSARRELEAAHNA
ncbi:MAG TPA: hypothetical protein VGN90_01405 [Pyrinomonadaceae bacterium]|jgi:hypothetical protein|nr:hypothetical protein [Pyrinomonadaceae bacterium]